MASWGQNPTAAADNCYSTFLGIGAGRRGGFFFRLLSDVIRLRALHRSVSGIRPALFDNLRIARMLRRTRPVQAFLTVRKRPEFLF